MVCLDIEMGVLGKSNFKSRAAFLFSFPFYQLTLFARSASSENSREEEKKAEHSGLPSTS